MMNSDDDKHNLSEADRALWRQYMGLDEVEVTTDVEDFAALLDQQSDDVKTHKKETAPRNISPKNIVKERAGFEIDRRTDDKLRKGKLTIEARCDLHGLRQDEAHERLEKFIFASIRSGKRCVLVITGKGKSRVSTESVIEPEKGILKQRVPEWLYGPVLRPFILKYYPAQAKDGGSGALYVYLRKQ